MLDEIEFRLRTEVQALRARHAAWRARRACREDALAGYPRLKQTYLSIFGVPLDLENPRKFTEKMQWRKVYDRRPILWTLCDKQLTSLWVEKTIGTREAQRWLVPRLFTVKRASDIPFDRLPENYVIKASHGSGLNIFIRKGENAPRPARNPSTRETVPDQRVRSRATRVGLLGPSPCPDRRASSHEPGRVRADGHKVPHVRRSLRCHPV